MGLYRVVLKQGQKGIDYLAGATRGEGCPLGMWASFENDIAPNDNWIRAGTTFDTTKYPFLALYLGGNTVPDRYDHNRPSDPELMNGTSESGFTLTMTNTAVPYDGVINWGYQVSHSRRLYVNDIIRSVSSADSNYGSTTEIPVKKGDLVRLTVGGLDLNDTINFAVWYKHPLFIKATSNMSESEATGILNLINQRESYSTEEVNTGKKWIDGKPIYRKAYYTSGRLQDNLVIATDVHRLVNVGGIIDTNESTSVAFPRVIPSYIREVRLNNSDHTLRTWLETSVNGAEIWVEYTKTTD